jgi:hypothetical protein
VRDRQTSLLGNSISVPIAGVASQHLLSHQSIGSALAYSVLVGAVDISADGFGEVLADLCRGFRYGAFRYVSTSLSSTKEKGYAGSLVQGSPNPSLQRLLHYLGRHE